MRPMEEWGEQGDERGQFFIRISDTQPQCHQTPACGRRISNATCTVYCTVLIQSCYISHERVFHFETKAHVTLTTTIATRVNLHCFSSVCVLFLLLLSPRLSLSSPLLFALISSCLILLLGRLI